MKYLFVHLPLRNKENPFAVAPCESKGWWKRQEGLRQKQKNMNICVMSHGNVVPI